MSDTPSTPGAPDTPEAETQTETERGVDRERVLAAEFSLGLLEGEELLAARGRMARDPAFAARREWWDDWFVPLSDDVAGAEPGDAVWDAIAAQVQAEAARGAAEGESAASVVQLDLERRVRRWQWIAAATSAAAVLALAVLLTAPGGVSPTPSPGPSNAPSFAANTAPLAASLPIGDTALRLGVTVLPGSGEMLVAADGLTADGVHDHELWLVPPDGSALQSLGVVVPGTVRRVPLAAEVVRNMDAGAALVLTREPLGGKPADAKAGPVVAEGALGAV